MPGHLIDRIGKPVCVYEIRPDILRRQRWRTYPADSVPQRRSRCLSAGTDQASHRCAHMMTGLISIIMMSTELAAILFKAERRFSLIEPVSVLMFLTYITAVIFMIQGR